MNGAAIATIESPRPSSATAISARSVSKSYPTRSGPLTILREIELTVFSSETVAIVGPSGSGKSTLLSILGTLEPPTGGELKIGDINPIALPPDKIADFRNRSIGFVFQDHYLLPQLTVWENVLLPTLAGAAAARAPERADSLIERVGLSARKEHRPAELSGGERQRAAIARALVNRPTVVLADEPTGNLDRKTADSIADLLLQLPQNESAALVIVTHSERLAARADRRFELVDCALSPIP